MIKKFILEYKKNGNTVECKSLKEIAKLLDIEYHQIRSIYQANGKKFLHPIIKNYCEFYRIYDNPALCPIHG